MILVSGLPSSGNHLLLTHIERGVLAKGEPEAVQIWHGDNKRPNLNREKGERLVMVVPVRDESMRAASVEKRIKHGGHFPTDVYTCRRHTMSLVVAEGIPVYFVSYEGLLQNPDGLGQHLFEWLELPWVPWPEKADPTAAQPHQGGLYDANKPHRSQGQTVTGEPPASRDTMIENWNDYQEGTRSTAIYPGSGTKLGLLYAILGLGGEAGEVSEHGKKSIRDDGGKITADRRDKIVKELGDVLWYCAAVAQEAKLTLEGARLLNPVHFPEKTVGYVGRGTAVGFGYMAARLVSEVGKAVDFALHAMPYTVPDGKHWTDVAQGRMLQSRLRTALGRILWYCERVAAEAGTTLDFAMSENLAKLASRKERGVLHGEGSGR